MPRLLWTDHLTEAVQFTQFISLLGVILSRLNEVLAFSVIRVFSVFFLLAVVMLMFHSSTKQSAGSSCCDIFTHPVRLLCFVPVSVFCTPCDSLACDTHKCLPVLCLKIVDGY